MERAVEGKPEERDENKTYYKLKDSCPGCEAEVLRHNLPQYRECVCGLMLDVPSYRETEKKIDFLWYVLFEGSVPQPMTVAYYDQLMTTVYLAVCGAIPPQTIMNEAV